MSKLPNNRQKGDPETTGHSWDGIEEFNNPMPRWWLWTFYLTIVFAIGYVIAFPAWPMIDRATEGVLGWSSRGQLAKEMSAADLARPDAFAAIDSIARMVDRLSAARDFGVVPTAALAVMHKEFGELSIAIDRISDTLQVEVAAKDGEAQRALAAALANERAAAMAGDRGVQRSAEAQQNMGQNGGQNTGQNGAQTNGQGANGSAADMFGQAASGNAQSNRDGQGRERTRPDGQPLHAQNSAASDRQPAGDDGRYA